MLHKVLPPVVTGAVVMLIGFNLAPVVAGIYWPQDQWVALLTMIFTIVAAVALPRLHRPDRDLPRPDLRLSRCPGCSTRPFGKITSYDAGAGQRRPSTCAGSTAAGVDAASWFGFPPQTTSVADGKEVVGWHAPTFTVTADPAGAARP